MHPKLRSLRRQLQLEVVATIFIIAASSFLYLKLVSEVREGEIRAVDEAILLTLRDPANRSNPIGPPWTEVMFRDLNGLRPSASRVHFPHLVDVTSVSLPAVTRPDGHPPGRRGHGPARDGCREAVITVERLAPAVS